jgi:hypothetical protein
MTHSTGPNTSVVHTSLDGDTLVRMVGRRK